MSIITLENMEFHAYHGCLEHEKQLGNTYYVTVDFELDTNKAGKTDALEDTLNYQSVYDIVKKEMEIPSNLIEHVAQRIIDSLSELFPQVSSFKVRLSKMNPPLGGKVEKVSIEVKS
ncbi:dihydroneopterin aldolase [Paludibacter sp. 221]|uniref:dihydroneopterin aldolase n=1 Tax=Paludibacter sp. 221 TaxID=2302939 RepID=UPI0013D288FC|nr:dihydroneopterin aldolase [Paludibacter sp. 221]NDV45915.1 dihydroneopterin aldolase [Paludibacter sp. 221]